MVSSAKPSDGASTGDVAGGASLGSLRSISESNNRGGYPAPLYAFAQSADASFESATLLSPGEQQISVTVFLVYDVN